MPEQEFQAAAAGERVERIGRLLEMLDRRGRIPLDELPLPAAELAALGVSADSRHAWLPGDVDLLSARLIRQHLSGRAGTWLADLQVHRVLGSTSTLLAEQSATASIHGRAHLAELQVAGRGRRGRSWQSPLGGSLALSLGFRCARPPAELGGLSLVVGLGVLDALERCGVPDLGLKWPNDLWLGEAKLAGILIELLQTPCGPEFSVGVGVNVRLPEAVRAGVDQAVADLAAAVDPVPERSVLAATVISSVVEFVEEFQQLGFGPFREAFDARHVLHGREAAVTGQGAQELVGQILGVSAAGALRLRTPGGEREFQGGEVSLRPR